MKSKLEKLKNSKDAKKEEPPETKVAEKNGTVDFKVETAVSYYKEIVLPEDSSFPGYKYSYSYKIPKVDSKVPHAEQINQEITNVTKEDNDTTYAFTEYITSNIQVVDAKGMLHSHSHFSTVCMDHKTKTLKSDGSGYCEDI